MPSYIELSKNATLPAASDPSKVVFAITDQGTIALSNESGSVVGGTVVTVTVSELQSLASSGSLSVGTLYHITDADSNNGLYDGTEIVLQALTTSSLSTRGIGKFYNPKYDQTETGFGIWTDLIKFQTNNISGSFQYNEDYYGNGTFLAVDPLDINQHIVFDTDFDGGYNFLRPDNPSDDWTTVTSLTGSSSGATIEVTNITVPSYASGSKVIWGGRVWGNLTGAVGSSNNPFELDNTNWELIDYNEADYNISWDEIEYDIINDFITVRKEAISGNIVEQTYNDWLDWDWYRAIKVFQWGNPFNQDEYTGMGQNRINNSMFFTINFRGRLCVNNEIKNYSSFGDSCFFEDDVRIRENIINDSGIFETFFSGDNCNFTNNTFNDSWIGYNYFAGYVGMSDNILNDSSISGNSIVYGDMERNTLLNSYIGENYIQYNGEINNNLLHSSIIGDTSNYLKYYCGITNNSLYNGSYISDLNMNQSGYVQRNSLTNESYINDINIGANSNISNNTLSTNSRIYGGTVASGSYIRYNSLTSEAYIGDNILTGSYIQYNNLQFSNIDTNTLANSSYIDYNSLTPDSSINYNTLDGNSSIAYNSLNNSSNINNNTLDSNNMIINCALFNSYNLTSQTTTVNNQFYANIG